MTTLNEIIGDKIMEFTKPKDIIIKINTITSRMTFKDRDDYADESDKVLHTQLMTYYAKFEKKELREDLKFEHDKINSILKMGSLDDLLSIKNFDVEVDVWDMRFNPNYRFITNYLSFERVC